MLRTILAIIAAKIIIKLSRRFGNQGTVMAGRVARRLDPGILRKLAGRVEKQIIIITGTNGKTTTSNMIAQILNADGHKIVHNRAGANMLNGITTAFIGATNLTGSRSWDYALLETDEANVAPLLKEVDAGNQFFSRPIGPLRRTRLYHRLNQRGRERPPPAVVAECGRSLDEQFPAGYRTALQLLRF